MKKILSIALSLAMMLCILPMATPEAKAATITEEYVRNKISSLLTIFPDGSRFTVDGTGSNCNNLIYGDGWSACLQCDNCKLENILKNNSKAKNTIVPSICNKTQKWSCCAFASFAFCYIFEHDLNDSELITFSSGSNGITDEFLSQLRIGDFVQCYESINSSTPSHYNIFLGYDSNYVYFYESNRNKPNQVEYSRTTRKRFGNALANNGKWKKLVVYRSKYYQSSLENPPETKDYYVLTAPDGFQRVRASDSTSSAHLGTLYTGDIVCITKYNADRSWGYLDNGVVAGWISLYYTTPTTHTHSFCNWTVSTAATCTTAGVKTRKCNNCSQTETETIAATGIHSYGNWYTEYSPSCVAGGTKRHDCSCGAFERDVIPATGHSFGNWYVVNDASCTANGSKRRDCSCGHFETSIITSAGHSYSSTFTIDTPATCTTAGSKSRHCTVCGAKTDITSIPATGHSFGNWYVVNNASCTANGSKRRDCSCGHFETSIITSAGHSYSSTFTIDTPATCTTAGSKSRHCTVCGAKTDITSIPATGHTFDNWYVVSNASCTANGTKRRDCSCGHFETSTITATGHKYDNNNDSTCNTCGAVRSVVLNGWVEGADGFWRYYENGNKITNAWRTTEKGYFYLTNDGVLARNAWIKTGTKWYFVNADGYMASNAWKKDSKGWCYLGADGAMKTNAWVRDSVGWCYVGADGYCVTNTWKKDSIGWCYLDSAGRMATNKWVMDSNGWCYVGADGYCVTSKWVQDSTKKWCYLNSNGNMVVNNWVQSSGKWYFMDSNGYMISNTSKYWNGKKYYFNASGVCTNP